MNVILIAAIACLLAGCGALKSVEGAPEVQIRSSDNATVAIQENGSRLVVITRGENVSAVILLPPAKEAAPKVSEPVEVEKK